MTAPDGPMLHVVDVCGTLVRDDTTLGLLRHHFRRRGRVGRGLLLYALTASASPLRFAAMVLEKIGDRDVLKHFAIALLAGERAESLDESGREYARELLAHRRVAPVWSHLDGAEGDRVLLASASLEPVVKALADELGALHVASTLEQRDGILTGRYAADLTGRKLEAIAERFGAELLDRPFAAYSDNFSDRALLSRAARACVVLRREAHRARWDGVTAEFVGRDG